VEGAKEEKQKRNSYDTTLNFFCELFISSSWYHHNSLKWMEFLWFVFRFQVRNKSVCWDSSGCCAHAVELTLWNLWLLTWSFAFV
jgi:hypothetical protein